MTDIHLVTFNCENLFAPYKFEKQNIDMDNVLREGWLANETLFEINNPISKELTDKDYFLGFLTMIYTARDSDRIIFCI